MMDGSGWYSFGQISMPFAMYKGGVVKQTFLFQSSTPPKPLQQSFVSDLGTEDEKPRNLRLEVTTTRVPLDGINFL